MRTRKRRKPDWGSRCGVCISLYSFTDAEGKLDFERNVVASSFARSPADIAHDPSCRCKAGMLSTVLRFVDSEFAIFNQPFDEGSIFHRVSRVLTTYCLYAFKKTAEQASLSDGYSRVFRASCFRCRASRHSSFIQG